MIIKPLWHKYIEIRVRIIIVFFFFYERCTEFGQTVKRKTYHVPVDAPNSDGGPKNVLRRIHDSYLQYYCYIDERWVFNVARYSIGKLYVDLVGKKLMEMRYQ